jgi:hypothetical protein
MNNQISTKHPDEEMHFLLFNLHILAQTGDEFLSMSFYG